MKKKFIFSIVLSIIFSFSSTAFAVDCPVTKVTKILSSAYSCSGGEHVGFMTEKGLGLSSNYVFLCSTNDNMDVLVMTAFETGKKVAFSGPASWGALCMQAKNGNSVNKLWLRK